MAEKVVAYFFATGRTKKATLKLAEAAGADVYEIRPEVPYTKKDLNWMNGKSRSSVEMKDRAFRPAIVKGDFEPGGYELIYLGFPIWWYTAPTLINSFLESYDFSGKRIVLFATSGSSGFGHTLRELQPSAPGAEFIEGRVMSGLISADRIAEILEK